MPFTHRLSGGERVAVYPMFERFELGGTNHLRPKPLREPRFVLDVHLGRLASYLRLLGFDTLYRNDYDDDELLAISRAQHRILLTRDTGLLKRSALTHGAFLHATDPRRQLREVLDRFQLDARIAPFTRCARCNGPVNAMAPDEHDPDRVPPPERDPKRTPPRKHDPDTGEPDRGDPDPGDPAERDPGHAPGIGDPKPKPPEKLDPGKLGRRSVQWPLRLSQCRDCRQVYWPGSHLTRLRQRLAEVGVPI